jgi:hypothetical protein
MGIGLGCQTEQDGFKGWLFGLIFPVAFPLGLVCGVLVFAGVIAIVLPVAAVQGFHRRRRFRASMKAKARFLAGAELQSKLASGEGTLIAELGPKGPFRIWWTEADILAKGRPISTDEELLAVWKGDPHPFNAQCYEDYVHPETGRALLTAIPGRQVRSDRFVTLPVVWVVPSRTEPPTSESA